MQTKECQQQINPKFKSNWKEQNNVNVWIGEILNQRQQRKRNNFSFCFKIWLLQFDIIDVLMRCELLHNLCRISYDMISTRFVFFRNACRKTINSEENHIEVQSNLPPVFANNDKVKFFFVDIFVWIHALKFNSRIDCNKISLFICWLRKCGLKIGTTS